MIAWRPRSVRAQRSCDREAEFDVGPWSARYESIYRDLIAKCASARGLGRS